jgi:hypothetical protein
MWFRGPCPETAFAWGALIHGFSLHASFFGFDKDEVGRVADG